METYQVEHLFRVLNALGEGPLWHPIEKRLYWTDILTGTLYRTNTDLTILEKTFLDIQVGAFAFRKNGGLILASDHGFMEWSYRILLGFACILCCQTSHFRCDLKFIPQSHRADSRVIGVDRR